MSSCSIYTFKWNLADFPVSRTQILDKNQISLAYHKRGRLDSSREIALAIAILCCSKNASQFLQ